MESSDSPINPPELPCDAVVLPSADEDRSDHERSSLPADSVESAQPIDVLDLERHETPAPEDTEVEMTDVQQNDDNVAKAATVGRIPPLFFLTPPNWKTFLETINSLVTHKVTGKMINDSVRIIPKTIEDFRAIQKFLESTNHSFATLHLKSEKPRKVALRGLPSSIPGHDIVMDLAAQGIEVQKAYCLKKRGTKVPLNIFLVELLPLPNWERIYDITEILSLKVNFRKFNTRGPRQCHACNRYGHSSYACSYPPRCVKCAGAHAPAECRRDRAEPPTCCNCGAAHTANYSGCPSAPRPNPPRSKAPMGAEKRPAIEDTTDVAPAAPEPVFVPRQVSYAAKVKSGPKRKPAPRTRDPPVEKVKTATPEIKWPSGPSPFCSATAPENTNSVVISAPENAPAPLKALMVRFNELLQEMLTLCASIHEQFK